MRNRWFILADDLTGAADSAVAFANRGIDTWVTWDQPAALMEKTTTVTAYNAASRELGNTEAVAAQRTALDKFVHDGTRVYKKIDSTLRGQPAAEILMLHGWLRAHSGAALGIVAPAYPALGRTTLGGHVYVNAVRLEETELWARDHTYPNANVLDILMSVGLKAAPVSLEEVRGQREALTMRLRDIASSGALAVCDAVTELDLECISTASRRFDVDCFFVGSGGLARALARTFEGASCTQDMHPTISSSGALIVVGSLASASRAAASELARNVGVHYFPLSLEVLMQASHSDKLQRFAADTIGALQAGKDALVEIVFENRPEPASIPTLLTGLSSLIAPCALAASAIAATGGETAAAVLASMGTTGIRMVSEIEPGVCLGVTTGARCVPVVTKAGAFGDAHTLMRVAERLRMIRHTGQLQ